MDRVHERVLAWLLGSIAGAMLFAGVAVLLAGVAAFAMLPERLRWELLRRSCCRLVWRSLLPEQQRDTCPADAGSCCRMSA
jgi:hypothetical protein